MCLKRNLHTHTLLAQWKHHDGESKLPYAKHSVAVIRNFPLGGLANLKMDQVCQR